MSKLGHTNAIMLPALLVSCSTGAQGSTAFHTLVTLVASVLGIDAIINGISQTDSCNNTIEAMHILMSHVPGLAIKLLQALGH